MDAITTVGLTKKYQSLIAVDRLDLQIQKGELFGLLGVNGAGKTTTLKMLTCLTPPTAGDGTVGGCSIRTDPIGVKAQIAVSPQETAVAPNLSVRENLALMGSLHGFSKEKRNRQLQAIAKEFGLADILNRKAGKLSGGYQRRLSIAMALMGQPSILFLDEPTLGLDVIARRELWDLIQKLKGSVTVILTTHYMDEAAALCDRIGIMKDGRLLAVGSTRELMNRTSATSLEDAFITIIKEQTP